MDWLEELANRRRLSSETYSEAEAKIATEDGGYEIDLVADSSGQPLTQPVLVAAGDSQGTYHIA